MAIKNLGEIKATRGLLYGARVIVTKQAVLKNRTDELAHLLGRIKEYLGEDEVLLIVHNDELNKNTRSMPINQQKAEPIRIFPQTWQGNNYAEWIREVTKEAVIVPTGGYVTWTGTNATPYRTGTLGDYTTNVPNQEPGW